MEATKPPFFPWFFRVSVELVRRPRDFFSSMRWTEIPINRAILFGFLCLCVGGGFRAWMELRMVDLSLNALSVDPDSFKTLGELFSLAPQEDIISVLTHRLRGYQVEKWLEFALTPIISYFSVYLFAGALWFFFRFSLLYKGPYENILRLSSLAQVPLLFSAIPVLGPPVALVWVLILLSIGFQSLHESRTFSRFFAMLSAVFLVRTMWAFGIGVAAQATFSPPELIPSLSEKQTPHTGPSNTDRS